MKGIFSSAFLKNSYFDYLTYKGRKQYDLICEYLGEKPKVSWNPMDGVNVCINSDDSQDIADLLYDNEVFTTVAPAYRTNGVYIVMLDYDKRLG